MSLSIIVPAYNEEKSVSNVVDVLVDNFPEAEVIVVNDGSSDGTLDKCKDKKCKIISHSVNKGYGASWKTGTLAASGEIIAFFDADGQFDVEDLKNLVDFFKKNSLDLASGWRGSDSYSPSLRKPGKYLLKVLACFLANKRIPDINCGLRVYKKSLLTRYLPLLPDGFSATLTSLLLFYSLNYNVDFIRIRVNKREGSSSVNQLRDGFGIIILMIRLIALFAPLRIFLPSSLVLIFLSIIYSLIEALKFGLGVPVLGAMVFLNGVLLFFLGIICDQVSALRLEKISREGEY